jgi:hypothetical protein
VVVPSLKADLRTEAKMAKNGEAKKIKWNGKKQNYSKQNYL